MNCREFERKWHELLDAETTGSFGEVPSIDEAEPRLLAHAVECPACRPIAARYQTLRHAIRAWRQPPAPPADLLERVLSTRAEPISIHEGRGAEPSPGGWPTRRQLVLLVAGLAAAVLVAVDLSLALHRIARQPDANPNEVAAELQSVSKPAMASPALNRALAEATSATWDLARSASEPAARIGRDVLGATVRDGDDVVDPIDPRRRSGRGPTTAW
jgi:hypothetical protein